MTVKSDEALPWQLARRNLIVFAVLLLFSLFWQSLDVFLGVLCGGAVALLSFHWMQFSLIKMFVQLDSGSARRFQSSYLLRLATVAAALYFCVAVLRVNPLALAAGLSVVVVSLFWTTIARLTASRRR